jgi:hypothetical protein
VILLAVPGGRGPVCVGGEVMKFSGALMGIRWHFVFLQITTLAGCFASGRACSATKNQSLASHVEQAFGLPCYFFSILPASQMPARDKLKHVLSSLTKSFISSPYN